MIVIFSKIGTHEGINFCALNCTQPSAALVIIKVFPDFVARSSILKDQVKRNLLSRNIFKLFNLLFCSWIQFNWFVVAIRADKACAKQGIVPIKNNSSFVKFWFIKWSQPDFLVCQLAQEVSSDTIISPIFRNKIKRKSISIWCCETIVYCNGTLLSFYLLDFFSQIRA